MREFLHVDDLADACLHLMDHYSDHSHINVGTGVDLSIRELAEKVRDVVYPAAELRFDTTKPDGTPRKVLDVSRLRGTGWSPSIDLDTGIRTTYQWFLDQQAASHSLRGIASAAAAG
jgi:GDP-L-fucose synthase